MGSLVQYLASYQVHPERRSGFCSFFLHAERRTAMLRNLPEGKVALGKPDKAADHAQDGCNLSFQ